MRNKNKIQILTYLREEEIEKNNIKISKEIICPKCSLPCLIEIKDYKMTFSGCKNDHMEKDVLISIYKNTQRIDESKIICDSCKKNNKASTFDNQFYAKKIFVLCVNLLIITIMI